MTGANWQATDWGVELDGWGLPIERCAALRKGRYSAIKEVCSRFFGDENDVGFIRAWREGMGRHGIAIDGLAFRRTIREVSKMKSHRFVYRVAENTLYPTHDDDDSVARYFQREHDPQNPHIEALTMEIFRTSSRDE